MQHRGFGRGDRADTRQHRGFGGEFRQQGENRPGGNPLDRLDKVLNLTPEQKTKVQPIMDKARPQLQAIRQDAMEKSKAVMQDTHSQIKSILTPDQQKKLDQIQQRAKPSATPSQGNQSSPAPQPA